MIQLRAACRGERSSLCVNRLFVILLLAALSPLQLLTPCPLTQIILLHLIQTNICETETFRFRVRGQSLRPALSHPLLQALVVL